MRFYTVSGLTLAMLLICASVPSRAADDDGVLRPEFTASLRGSVKMEAPPARCTMP